MAKKFKIIRRGTPVQRAKRTWRKIKWASIIAAALSGIFFLIVLLSSIGALLSGITAALGGKESNEGSLGPGGFGSSGKAKNLSQKVLSLSPEIEEEAAKQGIPGYAEILKAIMMVETGGEATIESFPDVLGCSESPFNTRYPYGIGTIDDYKYSLEVGVKTLAYLIKKLGCTSPNDENMVKNVVQSYNYGEQFFYWMKRVYGSDTFSVEIAHAYSEQHNNTGQPEYIPRFLNYFTFAAPGGGGAIASKGQFRWPLTDGGYAQITQTFYGTYNSPQHGAVDIGMPEGTPVYAAADGTVDWTQIWDGHSTGGNQSYGNLVRIDHGNGYSTLYAHLTKFVVNQTEKVTQGQLIGYVGTTGNSSGNHLHFEVIKGRIRIDPMQFFE